MIMYIQTESKETDIFAHLKKMQCWLFSDTIKARSFTFCMIITLLGVNIFMMTLTLFQSHKCVRNINCKWHVLDSCRQ